MKNSVCFSRFSNSAKPNRLIFRESPDETPTPMLSEETKGAELPIEVKKKSKGERKAMMDAIMGKVEGQEELEIVATDLEEVAKFVHEKFGISYNLYTSQDGNLVLELQGHKADYDPINNTLTGVIEGNNFQITKRDKNTFEFLMDYTDGKKLMSFFDIKRHSISVYIIDGTKKRLLVKNHSLKGEHSGIQLVKLLQSKGV